MRDFSSALKKKLDSKIQSGNNSLSSNLWVSRPTTPLTEDRYLEKQTVLTSENITKTSIAVCHPNMMRSATEVFIGYLESGVIKVIRASYAEEMSRHTWKSDIDFSQRADDFCLCFDGTMPKAPNGYIEFKTDKMPWIFWTLNGTLYAKVLQSENEPIVLAESNCSAVSAVRAMWSELGGFDFGLIVFFILSGSLYYCQLINGEWTDSEIVSFGPSGVTWEDVAAFRTWDYRVGVQLKSTDGNFFEMFTQFMGIGKQNVEHIEVNNVRTESDLIEVQYSNTQETEHVNISSVSAGTLYGGLYSLDMPVLVSAHNIEDENGDWGTIIMSVFSNFLVADQVSSNCLQFSLVDSWGATYYPNSAILGSDGKTVTLTFEDFNAAYGICEIKYIPGTVHSMATVLMESTSVSFTPQNLNPPSIPQPEVLSIRNLNSAGTEIAIEFTEALTGNFNGNEDKFTITTQEYDMVPGGTLSSKTKTVTGIKGYSSAEEVIDLSSGSASGISANKDKLSLEVLSNG